MWIISQKDTLWFECLNTLIVVKIFSQWSMIQTLLACMCVRECKVFHLFIFICFPLCTSFQMTKWPRTKWQERRKNIFSVTFRHSELHQGCLLRSRYCCGQYIKSDLIDFKPLTSSYILILIAKVKHNVLYKAVYLSRSIKPNKYSKIRYQS